MSSAESGSMFVRSSQPLQAEVDGEIVMLDPASSNYFGLADTGARIWELLAEPRTLADLVSTLTTEYAVDDETCRTQVMTFLETLNAAGLVSQE